MLLKLNPELRTIGSPAFPVDGGLPRREPSLGYLEMLDPSSACTKEKRYCYNYIFVVADVGMHYIERRIMDIENHHVASSIVEPVHIYSSHPSGPNQLR